MQLRGDIVLNIRCSFRTEILVLRNRPLCWGKHCLYIGKNALSYRFSWRWDWSQLLDKLVGVLFVLCWVAQQRDCHHVAYLLCIYYIICFTRLEIEYTAFTFEAFLLIPKLLIVILVTLTWNLSFFLFFLNTRDSN